MSFGDSISEDVFLSMQLTSKEIGLAVGLALMGFVFSTREFLLWLNVLNPFSGMIVYYLILFAVLYVLSRLDLVVFGFKIKNLQQTFGLLLITFAFFITVDFTSPYVQYVTMGNLTGASQIFYQCEDGAMWFLFSQVLPWASIEVIRLLTYVFTPFILTLIGGLLVSGKIHLQA